jgi:hypothetical protein
MPPGTVAVIAATSIVILLLALKKNIAKPNLEKAENV